MNPPHIVVQLIHIRGGLKGEIREFDSDEITIGCLSSCSVSFSADEPGVSAEHARIEREGNLFKLTDVSSFGTLVNGKPVQMTYLRSGDVIEFGPCGPKVSIIMEVAASSTQPETAARLPAAPPEAAAPPASAPATETPTAIGPAVGAPVVAASPAPAAVPPNQQVMPASLSLEPAPAASAVPKAMVPLVIQFGPTIRSYGELPVVIGAHSGADFMLKHPGILDRHAQIFFQSNGYWIRDLTGRGLLKVNLSQLDEGAVQLNKNDEILCGPHGPTFRFLGEGRLAEVEPVEEHDEAAGDSANVAQSQARPRAGNLLSRLFMVLKKR